MVVQFDTDNILKSSIVSQRYEVKLCDASRYENHYCGNDAILLTSAVRVVRL
jgi:hypothetical protein